MTPSPTTIAKRLSHPELCLRTRPRVATLDHVEWREEQGGKALTFEGHAAVFDERSEVLYDFYGPFREILRAGAFAGVISANEAGEEDTKFLGLNHERNQPLARCGNQSLALEEDDIGLLVRATLAPTQYAQDLRVLLESKTVHQMSFTFTTTADGSKWSYDYEDDGDLREVTAIARLYDVSPVVYPAYPQTDAGLRALGELRHRAHEIAAGARSMRPQDLAELGAALTVLDELGAHDDLAARARQHVNGRTQPSAETPPEPDPAGDQAARERHLRLRELGVPV